MTKIALTSVLLAALAAGPALADSCSKGPAPACPAGQDIVSTALAAGKFKTLATALTKAGLVEALQGSGPFTVFAPTDEAFAKLPEGTLEQLVKPENRATLKAILTYHVVAGRFMAKDVRHRTGATSLNGQRISFAADRTGVRVDEATVVKADIACSNGVIHVIDSVILPERKDIVDVAGQAGKFKTLLAAAKAAGLVDTLKGEGPLTIFAPTDEAFAKLPAGTVETLLKPENKSQLVQLLAYHVVKGRVFAEDALLAGQAKTLANLPVRIWQKEGLPYVEKSRILATDVDTSNGVIHIIDTVLVPEQAN
ncbi:MAG: fasciclin domain-containing protein [Planctomycetota bacterium]|jgi:uncharacterized surface protein with fasciclin (FAS1) repeats